MKHTCSIPAIVFTLLCPTVLLSQPAWQVQTGPVEEDLDTKHDHHGFNTL
jgi:hypothetical protein